MQLSRYLDLYRTETQDHLRRLDRGLLALEETGERAGLDEAFRAVHTIKGMASSMGFGDVAGLAHELEDRLDGLRRRKRRPGAKLIDRLLGDADRLRSAVDAAVQEQAPGASGPAAPPAPGAAGRGARAVPAAPEGTSLVAFVTFRADAPLPAVRAVMALRRVREDAELLASDPAEPDEDFDGRLILFLGGSPDTAALEASISAVGEVEAVRFAPPGAGREQDGVGQSAGPGSPDGSGAADDGGRARGLPPGAEDRRGRFLRVDLRHLDSLADGVAELGILQRGIELASAGGDADRLIELRSRSAHLVRELQKDVLDIRMVPVDEVFGRFPRLVRDAARSSGRDVAFTIEGRGIELDRAILDEIADPLVHLLRNAVAHGIEPPRERRAAGKPERGALVLRAERERARVLIEVSDDGRGIDRGRVLERAIERGLLAPEADALDDPSLLRVLATSGFSTAEEVTEVSGRGVGLDAVVERVRALGGSLALRSAEGEGTTFSIRLPLTLALAKALRVRVAGEVLVVPLTHVSEAVEFEPGMVVTAEGGAASDGRRAPDGRRVPAGRDTLRLRDRDIPLLRLGSLLGLDRPGDGAAVVVELGDRRWALAVDELLGRDQIVIREFDAAAGTLPVFSGATLLADGTPALVLDPVSVTQAGRLHG